MSLTIEKAKENEETMIIFLHRKINHFQENNADKIYMKWNNKWFVQQIVQKLR